MTIGPYELHVIETCRFKLDGGAIFGSVPKVIWDKSNPADDRNRVELAARALLVKGDRRTILIDTGLGTKLTLKQVRNYGLDTTQYDLHRSLAEHGISKEDVTDVVLTHLHFDHAGGATSTDGNRVVPTFPKATYYIQRAHWQHALKPTEKDKAGFIGADFMPLDANDALHFVDGPVELFPHLSLVVFNGHTPAQQLPRISSYGETMFFCCDLFPTTAHLRLPYISANDLWPVTTLGEKKNILELALAKQWILVFSHDPNVVAGKLVESAKAFELKPIALGLSKDTDRTS